MSEPAEDSPMIVTLKRAAAALQRTSIPFALTGGFAAYARGGEST